MKISYYFKKWRSYRRAKDELSRFSNRELRDMGINRSDIRTIARG